MCRKIKVLIVVPQLQTGGSEKVALSIAQYLDKSKFDVAIVSLYSYSGLPLERIADDKSIKVYYLSKKNGFDIGAFIGLYRLVDSIKPDVIQNHLHHLYITSIVSRLAGVPTCIHRFSNVAKKEASSVLRKIIFYLSFYVFKVKPIAISGAVKKTIIGYFGVKDVPVIYNGVDLGVFSDKCTDRVHLRTKYGLHKNDFVLLNVARFHSQKNHLMLMSAFIEISRIYSNVVMLLVGDGVCRDTIEQMVSSSGLIHKVSFLGIRNDIAQIMFASDIFLLSSDIEGTPNVILEAMAAEVPVISTNVGGVSELLADGEIGVLTPKGDLSAFTNAIVRLYEDKDLRCSISHKAKRVVVNRFSVKTMINSYEKLYTDYYFSQNIK